MIPDRSLPAIKLLVALPIVIFLAAPVVVVIVISFSGSAFLEFPPSTWSLRWYERYAYSTEWRGATLNSLVAASLSCAVATPLGTLAAYAAAIASGRTRSVLFIAFLLPLAVPVILMGVGIFMTFARFGLNNTIIGLVLAHSAIALPFVFLTVGASLSRFDFRQEHAARSLGASGVQTFLTVTLPQIRRGVVAGGLLAFAVSLDEVVVAIFIATGERATLTRRMFTSLRDQIEPTIAAVSTVLVVAVLLVLGAVVVTNSVSGRHGKPPAGSESPDG